LPFLGSTGKSGRSGEVTKFTKKTGGKAKQWRHLPGERDVLQKLDFFGFFALVRDGLPFSGPKEPECIPAHPTGESKRMNLPGGAPVFSVTDSPFPLKSKELKPMKAKTLF
jgi:hypothetical protein